MEQYVAIEGVFKSQIDLEIISSILLPKIPGIRFIGNTVVGLLRSPVARNTKYRAGTGQNAVSV